MFFPFFHVQRALLAVGIIMYFRFGLRSPMCQNSSSMCLLVPDGGVNSFHRCALGVFFHLGGIECHRIFVKIIGFHQYGVEQFFFVLLSYLVFYDVWFFYPFFSHVNKLGRGFAYGAVNLYAAKPAL